MDPISTACLAALAEITLAQTIGTIAGGIVGNRSDSLFCKLASGATERFVANARLPENHDLRKGLMNAYQRSISYVAETISGQARDMREQTLADRITAAAKHQLSADSPNASALMSLLTPLIAGPGDGEAGLRRDRMIATARDALIAWFEKETGETLPEHFRRLFAEAAPNGRAPWADVFRLYLAEVIKTTPRFEAIFLAGNVSEIVGRTITIETVVIELERGLESLGKQLGIVGAGIKELLVKQDTHGQDIRQLLKMFSELPLAAQAREENVQARAFVLLARKINLEVDDEAQALKELNRAVEELLKVKAAAEDGTHLDVLVDRTLRRIAEQSLRGEFDSAAAEAQSAFDDWERREAERRNKERQSGLVLIEANIRQHLLRRDSVIAAGWIERRIALGNNGEPVNAAALITEIGAWYDRGCERGLNLDLSVAIMLSRRAVALSPANGAANAQNWLGLALMSLGEREAGTERLEEAVTAFRATLEERTRERVPLGWAATQNNLGNALSRLGDREAGTERLEESVAAFREALQEYTRERVPLDWAMSQNNLGNALSRLGDREAGTERLEEAVAAFREALKEYTRERVPLGWAATQNNLGNALQSLGEREAGTERLEEAVAAFRETLQEYTRERFPLGWAATQNNLGNALQSLGEREAGTERLEEAVAAFREALMERTRERVPLDWAATQNNLGNALQRLGEREAGTRRLEEALAAFREALLEYTRERVPLGWAAIQEKFTETEQIIERRK